MFSPEINNLWRVNIQNLESMIETSSLNTGKVRFNVDAYTELRDVINKEYVDKVKKKHNALVGN